MARNRTPEASRWIEFLAAVLECGATSRIGLMIHIYHGRVESERIKLLRVEGVRLAELQPGFMMKIKEDVIYEFALESDLDPSFWRERAMMNGEGTND